MIYYRLRGHELQNDVQTMVQVFYPNLHYFGQRKSLPKKHQ